MATLCLTACGESDPTPTPKDAPKPSVHDGEIETFTGARTRVVWSQQQRSGKIDQHAAGKNLKLMGLDTVDGLGERAILDKVGSYARPLFTPDGERVVFSYKGITKSKSDVRSYSPSCYVVNFDGSGLRKLGEGYAEALWSDPADGTIWVHVARNFKDAKTVVMEGDRIERFRLDAPEERELVWNKTPVSTGGFRLSRDGAKMVGLYPWPEAGVVDLASGKLTRLDNGCWTSIAPDESGITWIFDGAHRNVTLFTSAGGEVATLALNGHPDLAGHKVYHPRWTNHPRYAVLTGPYLENKNAGADKVEVYLARFSEDLKSVESWMRVTDNKRADIYADVWIDESGEASLGEIAAEPVAVPSDGAWPAVREGLKFAWKSSRENVEADGKPFRVRAVGAARYGSRFGMAPGNGHFVAEEFKAPAADTSTVGLVVTPTEGEGTILEFGAHRLRQVGGELQWTTQTSAGQDLARFGEVEPGQPVAVWIQRSPDGISVALNGKPSAVRQSQLGLKRQPGEAGLRFGGAGWDGQIDHVAIYEGAVDAAALAPPAAALEITPIKGARVRAKLVETTESPEVEELGAYTRALVYHLYEVEEVVEGEIAPGDIAVAHWVFLDRLPAAGVPREIGKSYVIDIELFTAHPELKSERSFNNLSDLDAIVYFDTKTPELIDPKKP